ncbi:MAG: DMT family transporter [Desulfobacterales bacterium]
MSAQSKLLPLLGLIVAMALWASSFIVLKLAFRSYHPMVVIFGRMLVASVCFLFFLPRLRAVTFHRGDWKLILFMAVCEPCLYFLFEAKAIENTAASQAGMISALLPLLVAVAARIFLKEIITARTVLGFVLAIGGAVWMSLSGAASPLAPHPALGNLLEFLAMVCAAGYTIALKRLTARYSPLLLTAFQAFVGSLFYLPILFLPSTRLPAAVDPGGVLAILYLGAFISFAAYGLYNFGVSRIPVSQASAFVNLIPVFTILMAGLILGEQLTLSQCVAALVILAGVFLSQDRAERLFGFRTLQNTAADDKFARHSELT